MKSVLIFGLLLCGVCQGGEMATNDAWRDSIAKAVPYLKSDGTKWMNKRGCVSCHQIPFMLWSLGAAHENGFDITSSELKRWREWSTKTVNFVKPERKSDLDENKTLASNIDTMSALILALETYETNEEWRAEFVAALRKNQKDDGSWKSCGQLPDQKRPKHETTHVTALWTILALSSGSDDLEDIPKSAFSFIDDAPKAVSTEWWVVRMLVADRRGETELAKRLHGELAEQQNEDGGWGWVVGKESDALATGMAIYAFGKLAGEAKSDELSVKMDKAKSFLISTQKADGSWAVPGTKKSTRSHPTATANYWGTAWAVIGMLNVAD